LDKIRYVQNRENLECDICGRKIECGELVNEYRLIRTEYFCVDCLRKISQRYLDHEWNGGDINGSRST